MKTPPVALPVHAADGTVLGLCICIPSGRALNHLDENIVERWALRLTRQRNPRAVAPGSMGRAR